MARTFLALRNLLCVLFVAMGFAPAMGFAQDGTPALYDIEIIVFRNLNGKATPEDWAFEEARANRGKAKAPDEQTDSPEGRATTDDTLPTVQTLPREQLKLNGMEANLRASHNYQVVSHIAWTQAGATLRGDPGTLLSPLIDVDSPLSGTARLLRGTTLRLSFDLRMRNDEGPSYVLQETRQIKLGEKHYFDHPYFGVIATVNVHRP